MAHIERDQLSFQCDEEGRADSQLVAHFQEELGQSVDDTLSAKFLKELEETISHTLLLAYTKARQATIEEWGIDLNPYEPVYLGKLKRGIEVKALSKGHSSHKRIKRISGGWIEYSEGESEEEDPKDNPEEELVPSKPYSPEEKDPEDEDPEDEDPEEEPGVNLAQKEYYHSEEENPEKDDDSEYTPGDYSEDDE